MTETARRYMGNSVPRKEDPALLTGQTRFTDEIRLPGMLHLALLRSPHAHAKVLSVDASAAREQPGVVAVFTGEDLAEEWVIGIPSGWPVTEDIKIPDHWPLARGEVNHVGDGVAVVVATDRYRAQDALEFIEVDYEALPAVVDVEAALEDGAPLVHEEFGTNECYTWPLGTGDIDEAFESADVVVKGRYIQQRLIPSAIEPRAVVATPEPASGIVTVYSSTQVPHFVKDILSVICGVPDTKLRVVAPDVGGGFGAKLNVYAEEALALALARKLGVPIKWVEDRSENHLATIHGRGQVQHIELAATKRRQDPGHEGPAAGRHGRLPATPDPGHRHLRLLHLSWPLHLRRLLLRVHRRLHQPHPDRRLPRRRPLGGGLRPRAHHGRPGPRAGHGPGGAAPEEPDPTVRRADHDPGRRDVRLRRLRDLHAQGPGARRLRRAARRAADADARRGTSVQLGIGIGNFTESGGLSPSKVAAGVRLQSGGWEAATVSMLASGKVEVVTGTSPHGQGHVTSWSQIAADALGVDVDDVEVFHGDTAIAPYGRDTYGSSSLAVGGVAGAPRLREGGGKGQEDSGAHAGGRRGGHRVRGRDVLASPARRTGA